MSSQLHKQRRLTYGIPQKVLMGRRRRRPPARRRLAVGRQRVSVADVRTRISKSPTGAGPSTSSPPAPARWRNATASSTSTRTTKARERSRAPKHTASRQPLTCPEASGHHTITSLTTFRYCQADEPSQGSPLPAAGPECRFTRILKRSFGRKIAERPSFMAVAENKS